MKVHGSKVEENSVRGLLCVPKTVADEQASYRYHRYQSRSFIGCFPTKEDRDVIKTVKEVVTTGIDGGAQVSLFMP